MYGFTREDIDLDDIRQRIKKLSDEELPDRREACGVDILARRVPRRVAALRQATPGRAPERALAFA